MPDRRSPAGHVPGGLLAAVVTGTIFPPIAGCRDRGIVALELAAWGPRDEVCRSGLALTAEGHVVPGTCRDFVSAHDPESQQRMARTTRLLGGW